jgi:hypothetical protein
LERELRLAYEGGGLTAAASAHLKVVVSRFGPCGVTPWWTARVNALVGEPDRMFACLDEGFREHEVERLVKVHPIYDPYRDDPRFQALLRRFQLAD